MENNQAVNYKNSADIYQAIVNPDENWIYNLTAFAVFEERRIEWAKHFEENNSRYPNHDEIESWYQQQPYSEITKAKAEAENALIVYAKDVVESAVEAQTKEVTEGLIISEIRQARKFWLQFGPNFTASFIASTVFAGILVILYFSVIKDTSPSNIASKVKQQIEDQDDGKKTRSNK